jgi:hypothetical protein
MLQTMICITAAVLLLQDYTTICSPAPSEVSQNFF